MHGPSAGRRFDGGDVDRRIGGEIETLGDDDQLARHRLQRRARVAERLEVTEELPACVRTRTRRLPRTGDRTIEQLFKHGRPPWLRNPTILRCRLCGVHEVSDATITREPRMVHHITATST